MSVCTYPIVPDTMKPFTALSLPQRGGWTHSITGFTALSHICGDGGELWKKEGGKEKIDNP